MIRIIHAEGDSEESALGQLNEQLAQMRYTHVVSIETKNSGLLRTKLTAFIEVEEE